MEHGSTPMNTKTEAQKARDLCIDVLSSHGLLGRGLAPSVVRPEEVVPSDDASPSQSCKICGQRGSPLKMLICDLCEKAFHQSCYDTWPTKLPLDEWYCRICSRKKPESFLQNSAEEPFNTKTYKENISSMLKDDPYTSKVRIDSDCQAEVPDFSIPLPNDDDNSGEILELNLVVSTSLNRWDAIKPSKSNSIGNWIQCQNEISTSKDVKIVCGKWRRAPLRVTQTDDWDCSCALPWDPVHADCSVPQGGREEGDRMEVRTAGSFNQDKELETKEVTRHLKYVASLKSRLALAERKRKIGET